MPNASARNITSDLTMATFHHRSQALVRSICLWGPFVYLGWTFPFMCPIFESDVSVWMGTNPVFLLGFVAVVLVVSWQRSADARPKDLGGAR